MLTTMIVDENIRLKGFNLIVSETEFLILSIALSRMADSKYVNDKDRVIAERMHNDLYEVGADMAGVPQTDLVQDSPNLVKDLVKDTPQTEERPAGCSKDWSTSCTSCERYFSCDYLSGRQTGTGSPIGDYRDGADAWQTERSE